MLKFMQYMHGDMRMRIYEDICIGLKYFKPVSFHTSTSTSPNVSLCQKSTLSLRRCCCFFRRYLYQQSYWGSPPANSDRRENRLSQYQSLIPRDYVLVYSTILLSVYFANNSNFNPTFKIVQWAIIFYTSKRWISTWSISVSYRGGLRNYPHESGSAA